MVIADKHYNMPKMKNLLIMESSRNPNMAELLSPLLITKSTLDQVQMSLITSAMINQTI